MKMGWVGGDYGSLLRCYFSGSCLGQEKDMFHYVFFEAQIKRKQLRGILTAQCTHCALGLALERLTDERGPGLHLAKVYARDYGRPTAHLSCSTLSNLEGLYFLCTPHEQNILFRQQRESA